MNNSKTVLRRETLTKERHILDHPKTYPLRCIPRKRRALPFLAIRHGSLGSLFAVLHIKPLCFSPKIAVGFRVLLHFLVFIASIQSTAKGSWLGRVADISPAPGGKPPGSKASFTITNPLSGHAEVCLCQRASDRRWFNVRSVS